MIVAAVYGTTGGVLGAIISLTVNNAMFEVSAVPYFAIVIGLVLLMLGATMAQRAMQEAHEPKATRAIKGAWSAIVLLAGISCFALERHWSAATNFVSVIPMYMLLGAALSFTVSISLVDLIHMFSGCWERLAPSLAPPMMDSPQQMLAGFVGAVAMGAAFGIIFGIMDVVDSPNQMERLRAEQRAALPVGISMGAALGVVIAHLGEGREGYSTPGGRSEYFWTNIAKRVPTGSTAEGAGL